MASLGYLNFTEKRRSEEPVFLVRKGLVFDHSSISWASLGYQSELAFLKAGESQWGSNSAGDLLDQIEPCPESGKMLYSNKKGKGRGDNLLDQHKQSIPP